MTRNSKSLLLATLALLAMSPALRGQSPKTILTFTGATGATPRADLVAGPGGVLFGTTFYGGTACPPAGCGTVFSLIPPTAAGGAWTEGFVYSFPGNTTGANPEGELAMGAGGVLYGTAFSGGEGSCEGGCGTVYAITPPPEGDGTASPIYTFTGPDGANPTGWLAVGAGGVLYGSTVTGGNGPCTGGCGTVFSLTPPAIPGGIWTEAVLYSFQGAPDGANPYSGVLVGPGTPVTLYGTTVNGGTVDAACPSGCGTVFSLTQAGPKWTEGRQLLSFPIGANPYAGLKLNTTTGLLYGTAFAGGAAKCPAAGAGSPAGCGTIFTVPADFSAPLAKLYTFPGMPGGANPYGDVSFNQDQTVLYGTTVYGGSDSLGTLFDLTLSTGKVQVIHSFTGGADESNPFSGVTFDGGLTFDPGSYFGTTAPVTGPGSGTTDGTVYGEYCTVTPHCCPCKVR